MDHIVEATVWKIEEFGNPDINALLAQLEKSCKRNWLVYSGNGKKERQAASWILSQKFANRISEYWVDLYTFVDSVIKAATEIKYNSAQVTSAYKLYYNCRDIINKRQLEKKNKKKGITVIPEDWVI
jgi:hypothetical protein